MRYKIIIILLIVLPVLIQGASTINPLTKPRADTLYCQIDGSNCELLEESTCVATSFNVTVGTHDSGDLDSLNAFGGDNDNISISEVVGSPGFSLVINYTNCSSFNQIQINEFYDGSAGHDVDIEMYNYNTGAWDFIQDINDGSGYTLHTIAVSSLNYLSGTNASLRLNHADPGNANHDIFVDFAVLNFAVGGGSADTTCDGATCDVTNTGTLDGYEGATLLDGANCSVDLSCDPVAYDSEIMGLVNDVWVNESGDTMTGNLNMSGNDLIAINDIENTGAINLKPSNDGSDYLIFSTISNIPTIKTEGGIDLDIVGDATTMRVNVEDGIEWLTFATTSTGGGSSWFFSTTDFRMYASGDNDDFTTYRTVNNEPQLHTGMVNVTGKIHAENITSPLGGSYFWMNETSFRICGGC